ncbi:MAG TPA: TonB-dependent receptor plug domain-containing protein [Terriglobales bacterium]|nr:TonB-dependent receptor plug domain-containing protein [Terriglobales bacterium]
MRIILAVSLFLLFGLTPLLTSAQQSSQVSGTVVDPDHAAVAHANVRLLSADGRQIAETLTDNQGYFTFRESCPGHCLVEVHQLGFRLQKQSAAEQPVVLQVAPIQERVVITANRTETPTSEVGADITVIGSKEIEEQQPLLLTEVLQNTPGLAVVRSGGLGSNASVFARGGDSDHNKVLLDGIPINEPGGFWDFGNLAADDLDRIEIVRGPQSALFGSDAMASTIQLFSRRGTEEGARPHFRFNFDAGKYNTLHGGAAISGLTNQVDYDLSWDQLRTDNQDPNNAFRDSTASANLGWNPDERNHFRLILRGDSSLVGTSGQTAFGRPDLDSFFRRGEGFGGGSWHQQSSSSWDQRATYTFSRSRQVSRDLGLDPPFTPSFDGHVAPFEFFDFATNFLNDTRRHHLDYQSDLRLGSPIDAWGRHAVTFAFDWDREQGTIGDRDSTDPFTHAVRDNFGGTFQDQLVLRRLFLAAGMRVEHNGSFGFAVVPRGSAAYFLRQGSGFFGATKLKFNFGLGIKEPSFTQSFSRVPAFLGNPNLRPERVRAFDFGVDQRLWNEHAKLEVNWFDNRFRDLIEFETISFNPFTGSFININETKAQGAELVAEIAPRAGLRFTAEYTYLNGRIVKSNIPTDPVFGQGQQLLRRPRHSGSVGVSWNWRHLTVTSNALYVGRRVDSDFLGLIPPLTSDDPYTNWRLAWVYRFSKHVSYTGEFNNMLDQKYMEALGFPALRFTYRTGARFEF